VLLLRLLSTLLSGAKMLFIKYHIIKAPFDVSSGLLG